MNMSEVQGMNPREQHLSHLVKGISKKSDCLLCLTDVIVQVKGVKRSQEDCAAAQSLALLPASSEVKAEKLDLSSFNPFGPQPRPDVITVVPTKSINQRLIPKRTGKKRSRFYTTSSSDLASNPKVEVDIRSGADREKYLAALIKSLGDKEKFLLKRILLYGRCFEQRELELRTLISLGDQSSAVHEEFSDLQHRIVGYRAIRHHLYSWFHMCLVLDGLVPNVTSPDIVLSRWIRALKQGYSLESCSRMLIPISIVPREYLQYTDSAELAEALANFGIIRCPETLEYKVGLFDYERYLSRRVCHLYPPQEHFPPCLIVDVFRSIKTVLNPDGSSFDPFPFTIEDITFVDAAHLAHALWFSSVFPLRRSLPVPEFDST